MFTFLFRLGVVWVPFAAVLLLLWDSPLAYPVKLLSTFFHEFSHAVTAWALGIPVSHVEVNPDSSGATWVAVIPGTSGFIRRILVTNAGYVGSVVCGGVLLLAAGKLRYRRAFSVFLAVALLGLAVLFRLANPFAWAFCLLFAAGLCWVSFYGKDWHSKLLLQGLGFSSCLYALVDMKYVIFTRTHALGDALSMQELTGIHFMVWQVLWAVLSLIATLWFLWLLEVKKPAAQAAPKVAASNTRPKRDSPRRNSLRGLKRLVKKSPA